MEIVNAKSNHMTFIRKLYKEAFPKEERKPFVLIQKIRSEGKGEILALEDDGVFCGLAITFFNKDVVLIDYFAISAENRGQGLGSKAFNMLKKGMQTELLCWK